MVATAVVASFGASAAKVTPSVTQLMISKEGIANNIAVPDAGFNLNVKVEKDTPAASQIKIQFGAGVDLTTPKASLTGTVTQAAGSSSDGNVNITFGTGSFTFDNIQIDTTTANAHFITFDVSLGQPMNNGAAFNVAFSTGKVATASDATYTATDTGTVIDSGSGAIAKEVDQFTFAVTTQFDALINRTDNTTYIPAATADSFIAKITNNTALSRAITATGATALLSADFTGVLVGETTGTATTGLAPATVPVADKQILLTLDAAAATATSNTVTLAVDHAGTAITPSGLVNVLYTVAGDFTSGSKVLNSADNGGEWAVDATLINIPYLPVGFEGTSTSIHLSNEGNSAVDVSVSGFTTVDADGKSVTYPEVDLGMDLPAKSVTKISQGKIMELLGAPAGSKLSVTFNIDANEGVVNGYAFTTDDTGRTEISTSQQRGN